MAAFGKGKQKLGIQKGADLLKKAGLAEKIKGLKAAAKKKFEGAGQGRKRKQWMEACAWPHDDDDDPPSIRPSLGLQVGMAGRRVDIWQGPSENLL